MLLPGMLLAQIAATTPIEAVRPAEPSTLVLALIGAVTLVLYQLMIRNKSAKRSTGDVAGVTEKSQKRAA